MKMVLSHKKKVYRDEDFNAYDTLEEAIMNLLGIYESSIDIVQCPLCGREEELDYRVSTVECNCDKTK